MPDITVEDLGRGDLKLKQLKDGFRFGTDSVLLAWFTASFVRQNAKTRLLELGSGCGAAALLVSARAGACSIDCCEVMPEPYEILKQNIDENNLEGRLRAFNCDIRQLPKEVLGQQYDLVFFNPPFYRRTEGPAVDCKRANRLAGRFEEHGGLEDFVKAASARLKPSSGYAVMVMKSERLGEAVKLFEDNDLSPIRLMTVHPAVDKNATLFLLAGRKCGPRGQMRVLPPLITHFRNADGDIIETDKMIEIYNKEHRDCFI